MNIVEIKNIEKSYGDKKVLDNINIEIKRGNILGIIGKNGAGKTTLLKILLGILKQNEGEVKIDKCNGIGALIEEPGLCYDMTGFQNLKMKSMLLDNISDNDINSILKMVDLEKSKNIKVRKYSLGMKQRLGVALAVLGNPELIVLDEPINGLDPGGINNIRNYFLELKKKGHTLIVSSHILEELVKVGDEFIIIDEGKIVSFMTREEINNCFTNQIIIDSGLEVEMILKKYNILYEIKEGKYYIQDEKIRIKDICQILINNEIDFNGIYYKKITPEELFLKIVGEKNKC